MRAIRIHQNGGTDVMQWEEVPTPTPMAGQVRVKVEAAGVNFIDIYHRKGIYPVALPHILGLEGAGVVDALGSDVQGLGVGDRVAFTSVPGAYAEYVIAPFDKLVRLPQAIDSRTGAACMLQGMTAHYLSHTTYPLKSGNTCVVHSAAGGAGLLLVQAAKYRGARVIGVVSTPAKAALAKEGGADEVVVSTESDFESEVKRLTNGKGVQVVYDGVGKDTFMRGINCLAPLGMMVLYGQSSGSVEPFDPSILSSKGSLFLTRPVLFHYTADRKQLDYHAQATFDLITKGAMKIRISETFPMSEAAAAHQRLESRQTTGKLLLVNK